MENQTSSAAPTSRPRHPLARDNQGTPFEVPPNAIAWRVRRGGGRRGRPRSIFDSDGRPLDVALGASLDDLSNEGCEPGRYQLYPVDAEGRVIPGVIAVTEIPEEDEDTQERISDDSAATVGQLLATIRTQSETLCRALEATTSGYGPVRPAIPALPPTPAPTQIVVESPPAAEPAPLTTEAIMKMVMDAIQMFGPMLQAMGSANKPSLAGHTTAPDSP